MPFGPYKDFDECLADQKAKGKSDESARKICGALQARVEGSKQLEIAKVLGEQALKDEDK